MNFTIREARKLFKELKKKHPNKDIAVEIVFNSWTDDHFKVYISDTKFGFMKKYYNIDEIKKEGFYGAFKL